MLFFVCFFVWGVGGVISFPLSAAVVWFSCQYWCMLRGVPANVSAHAKTLNPPQTIVDTVDVVVDIVERRRRRKKNNAINSGHYVCNATVYNAAREAHALRLDQ
jgi:hypothetical protein